MALYQSQLQDDVFSAFSTKADLIHEKTPPPPASAADFTQEENTTMFNSNSISMTSFDDDDEMDSKEHEHNGDCLSLIFENINFVSEKIRIFLGIEDNINVESVDLMEGINKLCEYLIWNISSYDEEFTVISSICFFFYGGSWAGLAAGIAAVEIFSTKMAFEEVYQVYSKILSVDSPIDACSARFHLKEILKKIGMQIALMIAVLYCECWGEICISLAFGSKLDTLMRLQKFFDYGISNKDGVNASTVEWLALLSSVWGALISSTLFAICPGIITAMYMAIIGIQCFARGHCKIYFPFTSRSLELVSWKELVNPGDQFSVWSIIGISGLWQASYGYEGKGVFFTWLIFLLPVVKLIKLSNSVGGTV